MNRQIPVEKTLIFLIVLMLLVASIVFAQNEVIEIGTEAQLFVDDYLIDSHKNLKRILNQPKKDFSGNESIINIDNEFSDFNSTLEANGSIVYDPKIKKYVMFALGYCTGWRVHEKKRWDIVRIYRFTSKDAINWIKGDNGTPQWIFPRTIEDLYDPKSNSYATNIDVFCCYYDTKDNNYPYKGWQYFQAFKQDREGIYYMRSKDGIYWERGNQVAIGFGEYGYRTIHQNRRTLVGPADVSLFYYDKIEDRFLGIFKFYSPDPVEYGNHLRSRTYAFLPKGLNGYFDINHLDHIELVPPAAEKNNDKPHDEYYGSTAWRYESLWLGGLKIWHSGGDYAWSAKGCAFLKLVCSRDGIHWSKVPFENSDGYPEVFIPNGIEGGNNGKNDGGYITEFSQGPLRINDELIFYYGSSSYGKNHPYPKRVSGGGIFRARLRIDGFVSVDGGSLTTKLIKFKGSDLFVNAIGPITIEVIDEQNNVVGTETILGDSIRHLVTFKGNNLHKTVRGNKLILRFSIKQGGKLYSFSIK